jgi:hypothetical protein
VEHYSNAATIARGTVVHAVMEVAAGEGDTKKVVAARVAARRGAANPRVSAVERSGSDYHVSGEGLPRNWMNVLSHGGYNIYGLGDPGGGGS